MQLSFATRRERDWTVLEVAGEVDVHTAPQLRQRLVDLVNAGEVHLVVSLEKVTFIDSTGLGVLVGGLKRFRGQDGELRLVMTHEHVRKIFRITGLTNVFAIEDSVDKAVHP